MAAVALLTVAVAACSDGNGGSTDPDPDSDSDQVSVTDPGSGTQDTVRLREVGSCDEAGAPFGAHLTGFELYDSSVVAGDDRYSCEWRLPAEPDGWGLAIILVGHYANTPGYASENWEVGGFTHVDDPRVEPFDGLALSSEQGMSRAVHVMGRQFDARLQVVALRGQEPDHIPVDDAIGILLALTE